VPRIERFSAPFFIVDAFAQKPGGGNPAAVVLLDDTSDAPGDDAMLTSARELNQPMTAFVHHVQKNGVRQLRWFHVDGESEFCGHATFASGHVLLREVSDAADHVQFSTRAGKLTVNCSGEQSMSLTVPAVHTHTPSGDGSQTLSSTLERALGVPIVHATQGEFDVLAVVESQRSVAQMNPDWSVLAEIDARGVVVTAACDGSDVDFVSRFFATTPAGLEDAATGSGHAMLAPYWANRLSKQTALHALQLSQRGGKFWCDVLNDDRVRLSGRAFTFAHGTINLPVP